MDKDRMSYLTRKKWFINISLHRAAKKWFYQLMMMSMIVGVMGGIVYLVIPNPYPDPGTVEPWITTSFLGTKEIAYGAVNPWIIIPVLVGVTFIWCFTYIHMKFVSPLYSKLDKINKQIEILNKEAINRVNRGF